MYRATMMSGSTMDLTEKEFQYLIKNQKVRLVVLPKEGGRSRTINPASISDIIPIADALKAESDKLTRMGMWRCKAGNVHKAGNINDPHAWKCSCTVNLPKSGALLEGGYSQKLLKQISNNK